MELRIRICSFGSESELDKAFEQLDHYKISCRSYPPPETKLFKPVPTVQQD